MGNPKRILSIFLIICFFAFGQIKASQEHLISLTVDGRSEIIFSNDQLYVNHVSWSKPTNLNLDGNPTALVWSGNTSQLIPFSLDAEYWIRSFQGRDGAYAVQTGNGFLLSAIDNPNGSDNYSFEFHTAPLESSSEWMRINANGGLPFGHLDLNGMAGFQTDISYGSIIVFSATIDGSEEFIFSNGSLKIKHLSWAKPTNLIINGQITPLSWTNDYSQEISLTLPDNFQFVQTAGRRTIYPVETPEGFLLSVADENNGADYYSWEIVAIPEPATLGLLLVSSLLLLRKGKSK